VTLNHDLFQIESSLDSEEKLALLSFVAQEFGLDRFLTLAGPNLRGLVEFACEESSRNKIKNDLVYCDLSGHASADLSIVKNLPETLSRKGLLCIDGVDSTKKLNLLLKGLFLPVLQVPGFSIFARLGGARAISSISYQVDLFRRKYFFDIARKTRTKNSNQLPLVTVIVLTYNHEQFIAECLNSVLSQKGNFGMRVIIIDDASSDETARVVRNLVLGKSNDNCKIEFQSNDINCGVVKNIYNAIQMAAGCDYLTFCEGDDFWSTETRIERHLAFLLEHPECVMSFNTIEMCSADGSSRNIYEEQEAHIKSVLSGNSLASFNLIGNFTACFYDGDLIKIFPEELFDMYTVDWMFNMYCSQFGGIGHLRKALSVYRQHDCSEWSNRKESDKAFKINSLIDEYNKFLDYQYNEGFQKYKKMLLGWISNNYSEKFDQFELIVVDDVFPSEYSGFRYAEFTSYLRAFPKAIVLSSGKTLPFLGENSLNSLIRKYQIRHPELGGQIIDGTGHFPFQLGKLIYVNFLANAYAILPIAEEAMVPFAFTLYPGGGFALNGLECDRKLKRIFNSPCFQKVIVTQQLTLDYLIDKQLCQAEKIELIFGVVMPQDSFVAPVSKEKARWGYAKKRLDICFMAHRYTPHGEDKGYDVFINAANQLHTKHDDIYFHIVGPYDRRVLDVSLLGGNIEFHGTLDPECLDDFFKGMDIIMSPNLSGKLWPGSFDGFPTASCTEGGLRGTAIFCVDEFKSATGRFVDGQDIVLINYDIDHIVSKVEHYYNNPGDLKAVGECGSRRIQDLYSYESQMAPRVQILRDLIESPFIFDEEKLRNLEPCSLVTADNPLVVMLSPAPSKIWGFMKYYSPEPLKRFYRRFIKKRFGVEHV